VVGFHSPYDKAHAPHAAILADQFKLRALGTSTMHLAYVANGLFDAVVDHNVKVWDIAAAVALIDAAGGAVRYISDSPFPLREFDLKMERIFYLAGTLDGVAELKRLLGV
jgi:myo-inositol-1(or 4)-monophosphatase